MSIKRININKKLLSALCAGAGLLTLVGCSSKDVEKKPETRVFGTGEHIIYVAKPGGRLRIESHEGYDIVGVDNLCNSSLYTLDNIEKITGKKFDFYNVDIRDKDNLKKVLSKYKIDCCIHFAGLKAVGESVVKPVEYYDNNISGTLSLLEVLNDIGCKNIIFSCVYFVT